MSFSRKRPGIRTRIGPKKQIAFVCSGGAAKAGAFHVGVALALREKGFHFYGGLAPKDKSQPRPKRPQKPMQISTYVGSSAGSLVATYLASGYSIENIFNSFLNRKPTDIGDATPKILPKLTYPKMLRFRKELAREQVKQMMIFRRMLTSLMKGHWESLVEFKWLKTTGLFSTAGIEQYLREEALVSNAFDDYLADLFVVATQLNHSHKLVFGNNKLETPPGTPRADYYTHVPVSNACAASTALPFIFAPYPVDLGEYEAHCIDGEIRDTLSAHVAVDAGADLVIASYTHQPYHYVKSVGSLTEIGLSAILIQSIYLVIEQKINNIVRHKNKERLALNAVSDYCKQEGVPEHQRRKICEILEKELHFKQNVDTIYIHPSPTDHKMFFREHFSLSPKILAEVVKSGFRAASEILRHYEFADRPPRGRL